MKPLIVVTDAFTGETTEREMTDQEYAEYLYQQSLPDPQPTPNSGNE